MKKMTIFLILSMVLLNILGCNARKNSSKNSDSKNHGSEITNEYNTNLPISYKNHASLRIPSLIDMTGDGAEYEITVDESNYEFFDGFPTQTKSYNQQGYLGNTIKLKRTSTFYPTIINNLSEVTTIHWHGLEVTGENDGAAGSIAIVKPGESKTYELSVNQQASTIWYHPHAMGFTAQQIYQGLAGMIIIEDDTVNNLNLPTDYGINDIPLILQSKLFDSEGKLIYGYSKEGNKKIPIEDEDFLLKSAMFEDAVGPNSNTTKDFTIMTNGQYKPYIRLANEVVRFRILNSSNHGLMDLSLSDGSKVHVIGTDGGLLESPQEKELIEVVAGQRYEILVDLSKKEVGDELKLLANGQEVLSILINEESTLNKEIPNELVKINTFEAYMGQDITHRFILDNNLINDKAFDPKVINETFAKNEVYYFEIINDSRTNHSFHIHNSQFLVLEFNNQIVDYKDIGWKDTVYLRPQESMILQVKFRFEGDYMYHCHILMHEENGMMGKFKVQ